MTGAISPVELFVASLRRDSSAFFFIGHLCRLYHRLFFAACKVGTCAPR